jgi:hypothetical protein
MGGRTMYTGFWWEKPEGKRPLGRPKRKWEDNINIILERKVGVVWTGLI